jgi:hypothetical protein
LAGDVGVEITYGTKDVKKLRKWLATAPGALDPDRPLKLMGVYMMGQTDKTFVGSGRGEVKWAPLSKATYSIRQSRKGKRGESRPLMGEGQMRSRVGTEIRGPKSKRDLIVFLPAGVPYAKYHQEGARIRVFGRGKLRDLPKRPMLFFVKKDIQKTESVFKKWAAGTLDRWLRRKGLTKR